ncbi:MAG TPA: DUF3090 family protein [Acidimicrobiales bacterium]|nr:DUF3090 family protein [Acidimicrobiales bacterium]
MSASFDLPRPARVTVGAVGPPGKRVFYLQARQEDELVSLKLEKEQVLFLAGGLTEVLADLASPATVPGEPELQLEEPVEAAWAVGSMQLAYDADNDRVVLIAREIVEADQDDDEHEEPGEDADEAGPAAGPGGPSAGVARMHLTREQAAGVIEHGKRLLRAGRPPCPACGYPLDEEHSCPKMNGHRSARR